MVGPFKVGPSLHELELLPRVRSSRFGVEGVGRFVGQRALSRRPAGSSLGNGQRSGLAWTDSCSASACTHLPSGVHSRLSPQPRRCPQVRRWVCRLACCSGEAGFGGHRFFLGDRNRAVEVMMLAEVLEPLRQLTKELLLASNGQTNRDSPPHLSIFAYPRTSPILKTLQLFSSLLHSDGDGNAHPCPIVAQLASH